MANEDKSRNRRRQNTMGVDDERCMIEYNDLPIQVLLRSMWIFIISIHMHCIT